MSTSRTRLPPIIGAAFLLCGCQADPGEPPARSSTPDRIGLAAPAEVDRLEHDVLATIAGSTLPAEPIRDRVRRWAAAQPARPTPSELRARRLAFATAAVEDELVLRAARERGLTIDPATALTRVGPPAAIATLMARTGETETDLTRRLQARVALEQLTAEPPVVIDVAAWRVAHPGVGGNDDARLLATLEEAARVERRHVFVAELRARYQVGEPLADALRADERAARERARTLRHRSMGALR